MSELPKAVLFDFDGVLVDSEPHHLATFRAVLQDNGLGITDDDYYRNTLGMTDRDSFAYVYRKAGRDLPADTATQLIARKGEAMMARIRQGLIRPTGGAIDFVQAMAARCPLAICSGARRVEIEATLAALQLAACFPVIVAAGEAPGKPDPAGYLLAMRQLAALTGRSLTPSDCLVIEDSPTVTTSVRQVGFRVLAVAISVSPDRLTHADHVVASLDAPPARAFLGVR